MAEQPRDLLERYENSDADGVVKARQQAAGERASSYFDGVPRGQNNTAPDEFQTQFTTRTPGDKEILLSFNDDDTMGTWLPRALNWYAEMAQRNDLILGRDGTIVHRYNARDIDSHYTDLFASTPGVAYQARG